MSRSRPLEAKWLKTVVEIAIRAVGPKRVVKTVKETLNHAGLVLENNEYYLIGIGKAADAQVKQWMNSNHAPRDYRVFGVRGYGEGQVIKRFGGNHPIPGPESFRAGLALFNWIESFDAGLPVVILMSGGGSASVEHPMWGYSAAEISDATRKLLAGGYDISTINQIRAQWSALKGGQALAKLGNRPVVLSVHSDVPPPFETWVSSGPFDPGPFPTSDRARSVFAEMFPGKRWRDLPEIDPGDWQGLRILTGNNVSALQSIAHAVKRDGFVTEVFPEALSIDAAEAGKEIAELSQRSNADVLIFGGEPTVKLDDTPGNGGRMGRLALAYGLTDWHVPPYPMVAAATDGVDGASQGAGAFWLPGPFHQQTAQVAFDQFDSDTFFGKMGWLLRLPPTHVNVRDLVVVLKGTDKLKES